MAIIVPYLLGECNIRPKGSCDSMLRRHSWHRYDCPGTYEMDIYPPHPAAALAAADKRSAGGTGLVRYWSEGKVLTVYFHLYDVADLDHIGLLGREVLPYAAS